MRSRIKGSPGTADRKGKCMSTVERVLVTGGCGFIGANLVRRIRASGEWQVRVVDDLRTGRESYVPSDLAEVVIGDVADPEVLEPALEGVDAVVHLASQTGVLPSVEDPARDFEGSTMTTFRVLDACRSRGIARVVFASSGASVGDVTPPIHENIVPRPLSPYGAGKAGGRGVRAGVRRIVRHADDGAPVLERLRPVFAAQGQRDPELHHAVSAGRAARDLRRRLADTRLHPRPRPLRGDHRGGHDRRHRRRDLPARHLRRDIRGRARAADP